MKQKFIIAVDGASGTGKSTICKLLASEFDLMYIDTGAIYRSVALKSKQLNITLTEENKLKELCLSIPIHFEFKAGKNHIYIGSEDVSEAIRIQEVSMLASNVRAVPIVRASLLDMQRRLAKETTKNGSILDGRDIGTIVFPNADLKIYLTADDETRAKRRYDELKSKGQEVDYQKILQETVQRDKQDSQRAIAPLKQALDAIAVATDDLDVDGVKNRIAEIMRAKKLI